MIDDSQGRRVFFSSGGGRGKVEWAAKSIEWYKQEVKEIPRPNHGASAKDVIVELRLYVGEWTNFFGISHTYPWR